MTVFNKKIVAFLIILTFSFFVCYGTNSMYPTSDTGDKTIRADKKSGIIHQQSEWDRPVKKKRSLLPFIIGGVILAGGIIAAVLLLKKKEDPRGQWRIQMNHPLYDIPAFNFQMRGDSRESGTWTIVDYIDRGIWNLRDSNQITIRANQGSDFVLTGTIEGDHMEGTFAWGQFQINSGNWTATRTGDAPEEKAGKNSIRQAVK